ncbi:hypothetical protein [Caldivirga sp.]|uniref:hypothetical protein n=1 Tax=Caldivirga sp. TaxID=2080243 RepID=UPI003D0B42E5
MDFELEVFLNGCDVFMLIKPRNEETELGRVMSSILRWSITNADEANIINAPLAARLALGGINEAYGGSLSLDNDEFNGLLLVGEGGNVMLSGRFKSCVRDTSSILAIELSNKLVNSLMSVYSNISSSIYVYRLVEKSTVEASTIPEQQV